MALEAVGEILVGTVRIVGQVVFEVFAEVLVRGAGWLICRPFRRQIDPDGRVVAVVGIVFWIGVAVAAYAVFAA